MIEINNLCCLIGGREILKNINLQMREGEFIAIVGANGSGKSTLAKHLNALLIPTSGNVTVDGVDTCDESRRPSVRGHVGMVFQNPDSQSVASIVEDDTAFAPENLGLPEEETEARVDEALKSVGLGFARHRAISTLSGGQKQLTAIAGVLAMRPRYMVFDEGTSMLDPAAREDVLAYALRLRDERGMGIIWITHYMDEAAAADRVIVMSDGEIAADATAAEVFASDAFRKAKLELPPCAEISQRVGLPELALTPDTSVRAIERFAKNRASDIMSTPSRSAGGEPTVKIRNVSYTYRAPGENTPALRNVNLDIFPGITSIVGKTGSGKSTLLEIIGGLTKPDGGNIKFSKNCRVGLVFQYPEYQLFEETVYDDIAYGAKNLGLRGTELEERVEYAAELVGFPRERLQDNPFVLSGGMRRLAAIAGILVMRPNVLLLDEPAAGLDPQGKSKLFGILQAFVDSDADATVVFVTHSPDDAAENSDNVIVMSDGCAVMQAGVDKVFADKKTAKEMSLSLPAPAELCLGLRKRGFKTDNFYRTDDACRIIKSLL